MRRSGFRRPSPALAISILALVLATAGTSVAMTKITSSKEIGKGVVNSGDVHDGTLQLRDLSKKLRARLKAKTGAQGPQGVKGDPGAPGSALAYAHVLGSSADVDEAKTLGVTDAQVSHGNGTGKFCFTLPFAVKNAVANVDIESQDTAFATTDVGTGGGDCPNGTTVTVAIHVGGATPSGEDDDFYIAFN
ncbi:MAG TPA: hypothetical protein VH817_14275 [Thermoleophilaceae bacterium]|jgi:hypothetical protein